MIYGIPETARNTVYSTSFRHSWLPKPYELPEPRQSQRLEQETCCSRVVKGEDLCVYEFSPTRRRKYNVWYKLNLPHLKGKLCRGV